MAANPMATEPSPSPSPFRSPWRALRIAGGGAAFVAYIAAIHATTAPGTPSDAGALIAIVPPLVLAGLCAWRSADASARRLRLAGWIALCALAGALWPWLRKGYAWLYLAQHAGAFAALALGFGLSLRTGHRPLVSAVYLRIHGTLPPPVARYTRRVTVLWTGFGAAMTLASLLLFAFGEREHWSLLANVLTPLLVVATFAAEYLVRVCVLPAELRTGLVDSVRAFRRIPAGGRSAS